MFEQIMLMENDRLSKVRLSKISWESLFEDKTILYQAICDLLLNEENLLYYVSLKESTKTLNETKEYIKKLRSSGNIYTVVEDLFNSIGWNKNINITNTVFQGDLAEYLMSILLDKITNIETLISKISFKTSSSMPVYGNDNVYYDFENDILYFGESKFYNNVDSALEMAVSSIKKHATVEEISFVRNHTVAFLAENGEKRNKIIEKFEQVYASDIDIKSIIFIVNDDVYKKEDYENIIFKYFRSVDKINEFSSEVILVFLPILSKEEFLKYFVRRLKNE